MLYRFVSGDFPLTIMFLVVMAAFANRHWSGVRGYWTERDRFWRVVGRAGLILAVLAPLWIAAFDNWRQILGYSLSAHDRYKSDVFNTSLTPDAIRWISLALIAVSLVCAALIYARRQHGLGMLVLTFIFAGTFFYFFNGLRMRADVLLAKTSDSLNNPTMLNVAFILFWSLGMYLIICSVIAAAYAWLFSMLAIPLHIIFSIANRNKAGVDPSTLRTYRKLEQESPEQHTRAGESGEGPRVDKRRVAP